jgi:hypothetical protein
MPHLQCLKCIDWYCRRVPLQIVCRAGAIHISDVCGWRYQLDDKCVLVWSVGVLLDVTTLASSEATHTIDVAARSCGHARVVCGCEEEEEEEEEE